MLRFMFNENKRNDQGYMEQCNIEIARFIHLLRQRPVRRGANSKYYRLDLTAQAFVRALDELEQSIYCCHKFAEGIVQQTVAELSEDQIDQYHRHLYFYKNSFIRIFSILDKLGYFMNDFFDVHTERVKPKFSYFTVLRQLEKKAHPLLIEELQQWKYQFRSPMQRLRKKRNVEIHFINVEMMDDLLLEQDQSLETEQIENISANLADLDEGFQMACRSLHSVFAYAAKQLER